MSQRTVQIKAAGSLAITDFASRYLICCDALASTHAEPAFTVFERAFRDFMHYDLGFFDHESSRFECAENPLAATVLPMFSE